MYQAYLRIKQTNLMQTLKYGASYRFNVEGCEMLLQIKLMINGIGLIDKSSQIS